MAAGRGTRMEAGSLPKVCFPVVGVPAINRSIASYRACGVQTIVVVVGGDGQQVMDTVTSEFDGVLFAAQSEPKGTGDAARVGFEPLRRMGFDGLVMCVVGDKVVQPQAVKALLDGFDDLTCDGVLAVTEKPAARDMGHALVNARGEIEGVIEARNLRAAELFLRMDRLLRGSTGMVDARSLREECLKAMGSEKACVRFLGRVWQQLRKANRVGAAKLRSALPRKPGFVRVGSRYVAAAEMRRRRGHMNESLYLFKASVLARGLKSLTPDPSGEVYLTDIVAALANPPRGRPRSRLLPRLLRDPDWMIGFNTPDQLLNLEEKIRSRVRGPQRVGGMAAALSRRILKPAAEWLRLLETFSPGVRRRFAAVYGPDATVLEKHRAATLRPLRRFCQVYGPDRKVVIARAPAGVNIMGRHVDEVGGFINVTSVDYEALLVASPRNDDLVRLVRAGERGRGRREFAIGREIAALGWDDWLTYIRSERVREMILQARGDWANIVRAAAVRLQQHFKTQRLRGVDAVVQSTIPLAAGLGASSAMLVAVSEAFVALNGLEISPHQFVLLCGEGEWYLGTRGTAASHAGMKLGRRGHVTHLRFFPFEVDRLLPFPEGYRIVLCHAPVAGKAADGSRTRVRALAAMRAGLLVLRDRYPHLAHLMEHVRDLNPSRLGISLKELYGMFLDVPRHTSIPALKRLLSAEGRARLDEILSTVPGVRSLDLRDALLYGVAECARSGRTARNLERGDLHGMAPLLRASHDAERVVRYDRGGTASDYRWRASDSFLRRCIADLQSEDPDRVLRAQVELQPGRFGPARSAVRRTGGPAAAEIDRMVDIAQAVPGVIGAQLSGAGAGGCAMVIVRDDAVKALCRALRRNFPRSQGRSLHVDVCAFVEGAGLVST